MRNRFVVYFPRLARWLLAMLAIWGIPAVILWIAFSTVLHLWEERAASQAFEKVESRLRELFEKGSPPCFFQSRLLTFFDRIKGVPVSEKFLKNETARFLSEFPPDLMDLFLFDGQGVSVLPVENASSGTILFDHARRPVTIPIQLSDEESAVISNLVATPLEIIRGLVGRPNMVVPLGGNRRATWGIFCQIPQAPGRRISGMFALIHQAALPAAYTLSRIIPLIQTNDISLGYHHRDGNSLPPNELSKGETKDLLKRFTLEPESRFFSSGKAIAIQRMDRQTLLIGTTRLQDAKTTPLVITFFLYLVVSLLLLVPAYRKIVMEKPLRFSLGLRLPGYFALAFGLPFLTAALTGYFYLQERKEGFRAEHRKKMLQRLNEIDHAFDASIRRRALFYRKLMKTCQTHVANPTRLLQTLLPVYNANRFDYLFVTSSDSRHLLEQKFMPSLLRNIKPLSPAEQTENLESYAERGYFPSDYQIARLISSSSAIATAPMDQHETMMLKLIRQIGDETLRMHDRAKGLAISFTERLSDMAMESMFEQETLAFMRAARTCMGDFMPMEANGQFGMAYIDVLQGPDERGWYFVFLFHQLSTMERAYLERIMARPPFDPEATRLMAVSLNGASTNYPDRYAYRRFRPLLERLEGSIPNWSGKESIEGRPVDISALRCRHLKHYSLITVTSEDWLQKKVSELETVLLLWFLALAAGGVGLARLLAQRFLQPIGDLATGMEALSTRSYDVRLPVHSNDELGRLCSAFNEATAHLREMEIARIVQSDLLPAEVFRSGGWEFVGRNRMTQSVGGDLFDYSQLPDGRVSLMLGDVSGHGISAALVGAMAKAGFAILIERFPDQPDAIMQRINTAFFSLLGKTKMMTAFLGFFDPVSEVLVCANAGQSYPLLVDEDGKTTFVKLPSFPLGVRYKSVFKRDEISVKGKTLILYSDGMIEAANEQNKMYDYEKFAETASNGHRLSGPALMEYLMNQLRSFTGSVPWADDVTVVILRKTTPFRRGS
ncbi:MAG: SpoIIE family protein phosphatase [Candidatus Ozemobacteraceae bacterium]